MKKKYRAIRDIVPSFEFSAYINQSSDQAFAELVDRYPPKDEQENKAGEKKSQAKRSLWNESPPLVESQLDLHGITAQEAEKKTASYLLTQKQRKRKTVRIIPGKGLHSSGPGVLRDVVEAVLLEAKERNIVLGYRWDREDKEKSGAVLVFLS